MCFLKWLITGGQSSPAMGRCALGNVSGRAYL